MAREAMKLGDEVETKCNLHGWGNCVCVGGPPWFYAGVDPHDRGSRHAERKRDNGTKQTLSAHRTCMRKKMAT